MGNYIFQTITSIFCHNISISKCLANSFTQHDTHLAPPIFCNGWVYSQGRSSFPQPAWSRCLKSCVWYDNWVISPIIKPEERFKGYAYRIYCVVNFTDKKNQCNCESVVRNLQSTEKRDKKLKKLKCKWTRGKVQSSPQHNSGNTQLF